MSLTLTFLGHAGFLLDAGQHKIVIDPFLTGNDLAKQKPADIRCGHVVLTHGHFDHIADAVAIAKANKATGYGAFEVCNFLGEQGVESVEPGNPGGKITTPFGYVAYTQAFHSSSFEGRYMGMPLGVVVNAGGVTVYHTGDTGLFSDMQLIGEIYKPDIALIPIGDRFTMGPELATRAAEFIKPKVAVPMHYKTFGALVQDASGFKPDGVKVKVLEPGETWKYS
ncbi:MAG TPA: metal-dependent hydrolase [Gemmatimonadales bacterium]|nr:metal-dependent hydrolase [Gemmatimonadales bacterium]